MSASLHIGVAMLLAAAIAIVGTVGLSYVVDDCTEPICSATPQTTTTTRCTEDMPCWQHGTMGNGEGS